MRLKATTLALSHSLNGLSPSAEKAVGPDHPHSALLQSNLAWLYHSKGDYQVAEALYQRALPTQERALGSEHPDVAASLNRLALLYQATGKDGSGRRTGTQVGSDR